MTNDIYEIESSVVSTLEGLIKDPLTIIGYLAYMIYLSPHLSLFLLILLPITGFLIGRISRTLKRQSKDASAGWVKVCPYLMRPLAASVSSRVLAQNPC